MHDARKNPPAVTVAFWREAARRLGMGGSEPTLSVADLDNVVVMLSEARAEADGPDGSSVPIMTRLFVALDPELSHLLFDYAEDALGRDEARLVDELMDCLPGIRETVDYFRRISSAGGNDDLLDLIEHWDFDKSLEDNRALRHIRQSLPKTKH